MTSRRLFLSCGAATLLAGCERGWPWGDKPSFQSIDITGADYGRQLSLQDQNGRVWTIDDFKGKFTIVFFGYTQCPDVCPTTLMEIAQVKQALGQDGDRIRGVLVSVDPERDTPERLKSYVESFDPSFIALRGTPEQTQATAKDFRVIYSKSKGKTEGSYTMDHTAGCYVYDDNGQLRLFTRPNAGTEALLADLKILLAE